MSRSDEQIQPMTLGNMRQNRVRGLDVTCLRCGHHTEVNVDAWPDAKPVPSFGPRMRCSCCDKVGATAIPNWKERPDYVPGGARYEPRVHTRTTSGRGSDPWGQSQTIRW
jgi:hypothetical protein